MPDLRVTVIKTDGTVLFDNEKDAAQTTNHRDRTEVKQALEKGSGYSIQRKSHTLNNDFFYSATYFKEKGLIVRTALPYTVPTSSTSCPSTGATCGSPWH